MNKEENKMTLYRNNLGKNGEEIAVEYLKSLEYQIITRNFRCRFGEIDIIAYKDHTYIFVEVKTRKSLSFGRPAEAINRTKKNHLLNVAHFFIQYRRLNGCNFRFDAIEIITIPNIEINHLENIIM